MKFVGLQWVNEMSKVVPEIRLDFVSDGWNW